jgi:ubiquinone/menaquinone biosynthesis C-methylase UbiE
MKDLTAEETKNNWAYYYGSLVSGDTKSVKFEAEFKKFVGTHTWHNSIRIITGLGAIQDGMRILDAGCGWGRLLLGVLEQHTDLNVTAMDLSEDALRIGKNQIGTERKGNRIEWLSGDLQMMGLPDSTYDVVYSGRVFQHLNAPEKAAKEVLRVLRPGGRFVVFLQNKLCPLNVTYYSRTYSPAMVKSWFAGAGAQNLRVSTMDFYPPQLVGWMNLKNRMAYERVMESVPGLRYFGGKVVVWGNR